MGGQA